MSYFIGLATGFLVGFFVPTRVMMLCLVPVAVISVNIGTAMIFHNALSVAGPLIGLGIAYPTALSINRFMHD
ncbi:hypothetical protein [Dongia sp.]|uniref:hypothetical protein n=1 Tax=Dongia sp. TaxID=1977262 RepID=UPI0037539AA7